MTTPAFRAAAPGDVDALSELLIELYAHELPETPTPSASAGSGRSPGGSRTPP